MLQQRKNPTGRRPNPLNSQNPPNPLKTLMTRKLLPPFINVTTTKDLIITRIIIQHILPEVSLPAILSSACYQRLHSSQDSIQYQSVGTGSSLTNILFFDYFVFVFIFYEIFLTSNVKHPLGYLPNFLLIFPSEN